MMFDHNDSEGAIEEESIAWHRGLCAFAFVLVAGLAFALIAAIVGCSARATAAGAYAAEQQLCLRHSTHNERVACINRVRAAWAADGSAE